MRSKNNAVHSRLRSYHLISVTAVALILFFIPSNTKAQCSASISGYKNISCYGGSDGSITVLATGGTLPYTYSWSPYGGTSASAIGLSAGMYTVSVTDAIGCISVTTTAVTEPTEVTVGVTSVDENCGLSNGSVSVTASGGTGVLTYIWSSGSTAQTVTGLTGGSYTVTVKDANNCSKTAVATVYVNSVSVTSLSIISMISCNGHSDGGATVSGSGGVLPYTYSWFPSVSTGPTATGLNAGNYNVTLTDAVGCMAVSNVTITEPSPITAITNSGYTCGSISGSVSVSASGGTVPYGYVWTVGASGQTVSGLNMGTYTVTISDANNCSNTTTAIVSTLPSPVISSLTTTNVCVPTYGNATAVASGGSGTLTYNWSNGNTGMTGITGLTAGTYSISVIDAYGCAAVSSCTIIDDCVWPGDANRDLVADNNDILTIGIGYGSTGAVRSGASISWTGQQPPADWASNLKNGKNYKNIDCDGNGTINGSDTTAVKQNYGLTHNSKLAEAVYTEGLPDLTFNFPVDTTLPVLTINVPVILGTNAVQVNNVYGLAFSVNYDPTLVDTNKLDFKPNASWLGSFGTNLIYLNKNFGSMGRLDIGISRTDHQNVSGFGKIGDLIIIPKGNSEYKKLIVSASAIKAIDKSETLLSLNAGKDSVVIKKQILTGIGQHQTGATIGVYPNPSSDVINIDLSVHEVKEVKITSIVGEVIWTGSGFNNNIITVDAHSFPPGIYYLSVITSNERVVRQINIIKD